MVRLAQSHFRSSDQAEGELNLESSTLRGEISDVCSIAAEVLLKEGVPLDAPWARHEFVKVTTQVSGGVAVVIGEGLDVATATKVFDLEPKPNIVVFLEDDLAGQDALKANLVVNAKARGITMKTI